MGPQASTPAASRPRDLELGDFMAKLEEADRLARAVGNAFALHRRQDHHWTAEEIAQMVAAAVQLEPGADRDR